MPRLFLSAFPHSLKGGNFPMIHYEGRVFRPPSEAYSLIVQVTIGCKIGRAHV